MQGLSGSGILEQLGRAALGPGDSPATSSAIDSVAHDRVTQVRQVDPDLVGPAGMQLQAKEVHDLETCYHDSVGPGWAPAGGNNHPLSILLMAGDGRVDAHGTLVQVSPDQCGVAAADPAGGDGCAEPPVREIGLRHEHEPRCVSIQPMNDTRPAFGAAGQRSAACYQGVDQSVVPMPRRWVNDQARRFVDHSEMLVFEDNRERNGARLKSARWLVIRQADRHLLTPRKESRSSSWFSLDADAFVGDQASRLGSGEPELIG
jgi:hypothetical protein